MRESGDASFCADEQIALSAGKYRVAPRVWPKSYTNVTPGRVTS
jgi:hypothetical protein